MPAPTRRPIHAGVDFDSLIIDEIGSACAYARRLRRTKQGLPMQEVPGLRRTSHGLEEITREVVDWRLTTVVVGGQPDFWPHIAEVAETLTADPVIEASLGGTRGDQAAVQLWNAVIGPLFQQYARRRPELKWDRRLAGRLVGAWREVQTADATPHQTIAPLHNLQVFGEPVKIEAETVIRRMTDEDRDELWRHFGGRATGIPDLTPGRLDAWTDVIDLRWRMPRKPPLSDEIAARRIADVVTALRLHHPGVTGTTILWTRPDPADAPIGGPFAGSSLYAPHGAPRFAHPLKTNVGPNDAKPLRNLVERVSSARADHKFALALRRFDSAYERHVPEDSLIDLWVAFEALFVPDSTQELSYRASLRIARLAGKTTKERQDAFAVARASYGARSKVVHGTQLPSSLGEILEQTRQLARQALQAWLLDPPSEGVDGLDRAALA